MKIRLLFPALFTLLLVAGCGRGTDDEHAAAHTDAPGHAHDGHDEEAPQGPHGGRLLQQDGYAVELAIRETGTPPHYQAWLYRDGEPLPSARASVEVTLSRLGGTTEVHPLLPQPDGSLRAAGIVGEPHSFDVVVEARVDEQALQWSYPSYEGRTTIAADIAAVAGIRTAAAGAGVIADEHRVQGLLTPIEGRIARAAARYPGPIRSLVAQVGDRVRAGDVLATVESNLGLAEYPVTAPISGVVLDRAAALGAIAREDAPLYEIADLSSLWVDLHLFGADAQHIGPGVPVQVTRLTDGAVAETRIERVLPGTATASQSTVARATLDNADGAWRPGSAVGARITVARHEAALVVPLSALQVFRDWDVVFIRVGDTYEVRPVQLGRRDGRQVEILAGLEPGDEVVVEQSYLVKADIEKSGASHDH